MPAMFALWSSLSNRLSGLCASRFMQATSSLSALPFTTRSTQQFSSLARQRCLLNMSQTSPSSSLSLSSTKAATSLLQPSSSSRVNTVTSSRSISFEYMHRRGQYCKVRRKKLHPLDGNPQMRGVVLKTLVKKPKKPNSANRKCVRLRLTNGKEVTAYVPGEGHNLQEHNIVLVQGGKLQDTPGVKLVCVRGKYDLAHVKKRV